jgi:hypothetical protein
MKEAVLPPSTGTAVAMACFAVFLAFIGYLAVAVGGLELAWWALIPTWGLAGLCVWSIYRVMQLRRLFSLRVSQRRFAIYGSTVHQPEVACIRRHKELMFDGVRVELAGGEWLGILSAHHHPADVLRVFRTYGYPVDDGFSLE